MTHARERKIAIIGTGVVGAHAFEALKQQGWTPGENLFIFDKQLVSHVLIGILDVTDPESLESKLSTFGSGCSVLNASGATAVDPGENNHTAYYLVNADGPRNLTTLATKKGFDLYSMATAFAFRNGYQPSYHEPFTEEDELLHPEDPVHSVYAHSKAVGERYVLEGGQRLIRINWAFGNVPPGGHQLFLHAMLNRLKEQLRTGENPDVSAICDQTGNLTYAPSLGRILANILTAEQPLFEGSLNLVNLNHTTLEGYIKESTALLSRASWLTEDERSAWEAANITGIEPVTTQDYNERQKRRAQMEDKPKPIFADRPSFSALDTRKAQSLGLALPPWEEDLAKYLENDFNAHLER